MTSHRRSEAPTAGVRYRRLLAGAALLALTAAGPVMAAEAPGAAQPILFKADELTWDARNKVVRAVGNVEATQTGRTVFADEVVYEELRDLVTARGRVTLFEPKGEVVTADSVELTGDLKNGVIENMRAVLADGTRVTAARGERTDGLVGTAEDVRYTPCLPCETDPSRAPLWQIRAVEVVQDQAERTIEFSHAWLEFAGVPVAYTPYFYAPDPGVKRKSGVLVPGVGQSSDLGFVVQVPVYLVLDDQQDVTVTPWFTSEEGPVLEAEYRAALKNGEIEASGSGTYDSRQRWRGHIFGEGRYDIDETWRAGLDVERTSDRTYLRRYGFDNERSLTSRLYAEDFIGSRDYFVGRAIAFQNLEDDVDQETIPYVAPWLDYWHSGERDGLGGETDVRLDLLALTRERGTDTRRLSARAQWQRPFIGPLGDLVTVSGALWADGYDVEDQTSPGREDRYSGTTGRLFPQAGAQWRLPLIREGETVQQIVEPIAEVVLAPNYGNVSRIPNEDSRDFELQDTNLFGFDRLPGIDRVDEGPRINYGLKWSAYGDGGSSATAFVGQSYRFFDDDTFGEGTGLEDNVSDVVAAVDLVPVPWLDLLYRNRLDHETLAVRRNELGARVGVDALRVRTTYVRYDGQPQNDLRGREEIDYALDARLTRFWRTRIFGITDIRSESQREIGLRLTYEDDCLLFSTEVARENFRDRDVEPTNVVFFRLGLKTFADIGTGFSAGGGGGG